MMQYGHMLFDLHLLIRYFLAGLFTYLFVKLTPIVSAHMIVWFMGLFALYAGWHAFVDGRETKVFTADAIMQAVYLDKGSHRVEFRYMPTTFVVGVVISVVTLVFLCISYVFVTFRRRTKKTDS